VTNPNTATIGATQRDLLICVPSFRNKRKPPGQRRCSAQARLSTTFRSPPCLFSLSLRRSIPSDSPGHPPTPAVPSAGSHRAVLQILLYYGDNRMYVFSDCGTRGKLRFELG